VLEASTGRVERPVIYLVDLDHFKQVNDGYGHAAGDAVICIAADRLRAVVGADSLVARLGGDEFVIIQPASASLGDVQRTAGDIVDALAQPYSVGGKQFSLSATVGVRICPTDVTDTTQLYKAADRALYKAKQAGRNGYAIYDDALHRALTERRQIEQRLRVMASDPQACGIVYQPLCDVHYGEVIGFEALMRLGNGGDYSVSPEVFIPIAEDLGLIADLGANILNRALAFAITLPDPMTIAVNVSPRQFFAADPAQSIVEVTRRALEATGFPPHRLELEITEGLFLKVTDEVTAQLNGLKALGVKLVLDDFGVGYCSLGYLARFPVDKLKIDKSFLAEAIEQPERILPILSSIASLGQTLGLEVVAEGIESPEQAKIAERVGCQQLQGFYFCRPIYETDVAAYILCNRIGTQKVKSGCQLAASDGDGGFWSLLAWIQTSGTWSPVISKAS
jgi:diguanylate cyclase (GGDEF)-like protein